MGGMNGADHCYCKQDAENRGLAGLRELSPLAPVGSHGGAGECPGVPPTPQVGGFSASCPLWGHPCPDEVNSSFPIATDHGELSSGKCDMSIPDVPVVL